MSPFSFAEVVQKGRDLQTLWGRPVSNFPHGYKQPWKKAEYLDEINLPWQEYLFYWPKSWFSHLFSLQLWTIIGVSFFLHL